MDGQAPSVHFVNHAIGIYIYTLLDGKDKIDKKCMSKNVFKLDDNCACLHKLNHVFFINVIRKSCANVLVFYYKLLIFSPVK